MKRLLIFGLAVVILGVVFSPVLATVIPFDADHTGESKDMEYDWMLSGTSYSLTVPIPDNAVKSYNDRNVQRSGFYYAIPQFVTSDDPVIQDIAAALNQAAEGRSDLYKVRMALSFVQKCIKYAADDGEYWQFPLETLSCGKGDCEDQAFLFASVVEAMGYDVVMIHQPNHMVVGANIETSGFSVMHDGKNYVVCDPTDIYGPGHDNGMLIEFVVDPSSYLFVNVCILILAAALIAIAYILMRS